MLAIPKPFSYGWEAEMCDVMWGNTPQWSEELRELAEKGFQGLRVECTLDIHPYRFLEYLAEVDFPSLIALTIETPVDSGGAMISNVDGLSFQNLLKLPQAAQLEYLGFIKTKVGVEGIEAILGKGVFPNLTVLNFVGTILTDEEVCRMREKYPEVDIRACS